MPNRIAARSRNRSTVVPDAVSNRSRCGSSFAVAARSTANQSGRSSITRRGILKGAAALTFADGSVGTIHYLANGNKGFPKERIEVFAAGRVLQLDNFLKLRGWGWSGFSKLNLWRQDKGIQPCVNAFVAAIKGNGPAPITLAEILEVSGLSIAIAESIQ